jgi:hypothetical protein
MPCAAGVYGRPAKLNERPNFRSSAAEVLRSKRRGVGVGQKIVASIARSYAPRKKYKNLARHIKRTDCVNLSALLR